MFATRKTVLTIVLGTLAPFAGFGFAVAQEDGSRAMLEEITVTAQRREQSLQEVPISIETITVRFLEPTVAIADGTFEITGITGPDGSAAPSLKGLFSNLKVKSRLVS